MLVLDTNIVIAYFAEEEPVVQALEEILEQGEKVVVPTIVKAETLSYANLGPSILERMQAWFLNTEQLVLDSRIADKAADIRREYRLKLIDAVIAATALSVQAKLVTRDADFMRVSDLETVKW